MHQPHRWPGRAVTSASARMARANLAASQHPQGGQLVSAARVLGVASPRSENKTAFF